MGAFSNILKSVDPVGKQLFQPKDEGGAGLPDFLNLYGYGTPKLAAPGQASSPPPPPPSLVTPAQIATSDDQRAASRKQQQASLARKGRASTILTNDSLGAAG